MAHLVVDVSGHGFGHLAQVAPVLEALALRRPDVRFTVRTRVLAEAAARNIPVSFATAPAPPDVGLAMFAPADVDAPSTAAAYAALHADWDTVVAAEAARLAALKPDLLLADVPYSSLAAAAAAGIPAVALSSLNWTDLYEAYCGGAPEAGRVLAHMRAAYRSARLFLQITPHMPMADLPHRRSIGPVARIGRNLGERLRARLGVGAGERLVLVSFGGIANPWRGEGLPRLDGVHWVLGEGRADARDDITCIDETAVPFIDVLASCDAVVTKTGYGLFTEAACNGVRVLYVARPDWPESPHLEPWIERVGTARALDRTAFDSGALGANLAALLDRPPAPPVAPTGAAAAADALAALL